MGFAFPIQLVLFQPTCFLVLALDSLSDPAAGAVSEWLRGPRCLAGVKPRWCHSEGHLQSPAAMALGLGSAQQLQGLVVPQGSVTAGHGVKH